MNGGVRCALSLRSIDTTYKDCRDVPYLRICDASAASRSEFSENDAVTAMKQHRSAFNVVLAGGQAHSPELRDAGFRETACIASPGEKKAGFTGPHSICIWQRPGGCSTVGMNYYLVNAVNQRKGY